MPPLCFVLMPRGQKAVASGRMVDFDWVYADVVLPAIAAAGMQPLRAEEGCAGNRLMFEWLVLCDYAVADVTHASAEAYYALGLRRGVRPGTSVLLSADADRLPVDVEPLRCLPYRVEPSGKPVDAEGCRDGLRGLLAAAHAGPAVESPVFQLVEGNRPSDISRLKTDVFRERVDYAADLRAQLAEARRVGPPAVRRVADALGDLEQHDAGVVVDLLLSFRAVKDWQGMVDTVRRMSAPVAHTKLVREQLGFALNRLGRRDEAEVVLREVIADAGPSSETNGLLGRVYKDRWEAACQAGQTAIAESWLAKAIDTYLEGFEADWRDAYPGVNAVTLMELSDPPDPRATELLPVVRYAVKRRIASGASDYWDHATMLELAVLARDEAAAREAARCAQAAVREPWEPENTARNLRLIREARARRGERLAWAETLEHALSSLEATAWPA